MDAQKTTVTILNRIYPPSPGITGESAAELVSYLLSKGFGVNVVAVDANYKGGASKETLGGKVVRVRTFYNGEGRFLRLFSSLYEGFQMVRKACRLKSDVTICMTDPPLLNMWASLFFRKKHPWIFWAMDLYPEAFMADGLVTRRNPGYKFINWILQKFPPTYIVSLGPSQAEYLSAKLGASIQMAQLPCGVFENMETSGIGERPLWAANPEKTYIGYVGNLGKAHSYEFVKAVIDNADKSRYQVILCLYGTNAQRLLDYASGKENVTVVPHVKREDLKFIDVHLATLLPEWVNVCVPSKTVSSVCAGSTFIYSGKPESDNWKLLGQAGWRMDTDTPPNEIGAFIEKLSIQSIEEKKLAARKLAEELNIQKNVAFERICYFLEQLQGSAHAYKKNNQSAPVKTGKPVVNTKDFFTNVLKR